MFFLFLIWSALNGVLDEECGFLGNYCQVELRLQSKSNLIQDCRYHCLPAKVNVGSDSL